MSMPMASLAGRVVLITGAAAGLGRALAFACARSGASLALLDLHEEELQSLVAALKCRSASAVADVRDRAALTSAVQELTTRLGPIDVAIANAGIGFETSALSFRAEDIEEHVRVNLLGVVNTIGAVLPGMLERGRGHLVAISSVASYRGLPLMAGYCISKSGVNALMDSLRVELKPRGITTTTICPGWIRTRLTAGLNIPPRELMEADDAARRIVDAVQGERIFVTFPRRTAWQARLLTVLPRRLSDRIVARLMNAFRRR